MEFIIIILLVLLAHILIMYSTLENNKAAVLLQFNQIMEYEKMKENLIYDLINKTNNKTNSELEELLKTNNRKINDNIEIINKIDILLKKYTNKGDQSILKAINDIDKLIIEKAMHYNEAVLKYNYSINIFLAKSIIILFKMETFNFIESKC